MTDINGLEYRLRNENPRRLTYDQIEIAFVEAADEIERLVALLNTREAELDHAAYKHAEASDEIERLTKSNTILRATQ